MFVGFDRKGLEAALVNMAGTRHVVVSVPAHAVRVRHPAAKVAEIAVVFGPEDKMPMVGHQHKGQNPHGALLQGFGHDAEKRRVIGWLFKQRQPCHGTIEGMVNNATRGLSSTARHGPIVRQSGAPVKRKRAASPFFPVEHGAAWANRKAEWRACQGETSCVPFSFFSFPVPRAAAPVAAPARPRHRPLALWRRVPGQGTVVWTCL